MVNGFPDLLDVAVKIHQVLILWVLILFKTSFSLHLKKTKQNMKLQL